MPRNNQFADDGLVTDFAIHVKDRLSTLEDRGTGWDDSVTSLTDLIQAEAQSRDGAIQDHADYAEGRYANKLDLVQPGSKATIHHVEGVSGSPTYDVIRVSAGALNLKKVYQPMANAQGVTLAHNYGATWDTFRDLKRKNGYTAIVNSDTWVAVSNGSDYVRPVGLQIIDGRAVQNFGLGPDMVGSDLEALIVKYDGSVIPARSSDNKTAQDYVDEGAYFSVGAGPILCENGILRNWQNDPSYDSAYASTLMARTIFGQASNGDFIIILVKGDTGSVGLAGNSMGQLAIQEGCHIAVVLDGAGSTQAMWKGVNVRPSTSLSGVRRVHSMIVITAPETNDYDTGDIPVTLESNVSGPVTSSKPSAFMRQVNERIFFTLNAVTTIPLDAWYMLRDEPLDAVYQGSRADMQGILIGSNGVPIAASFDSDPNPGGLSVRSPLSAATQVCGTLTWVAKFA